MNPIQKALAQADKIIAANADLERLSAERPDLRACGYVHDAEGRCTYESA